MKHLKKFERFDIKLSEGLQYHINNNLKLVESVYNRIRFLVGFGK